MTIPFKYELGTVLKDIVTGFEGVVMSRTQYFTGCSHYGLCSQQLNKDGKMQEWEYIDESRLKLVGKKSVSFQKDEPTSGPHPNPPQA